MILAARLTLIGMLIAQLPLSTTAQEIEPATAKGAIESASREQRVISKTQRSAASGESTHSSVDPEKLDEVVVTGSHIRGASNSSSPVITLDAEDIRAS